MICLVIYPDFASVKTSFMIPCWSVVMDRSSSSREIAVFLMRLKKSELRKIFAYASGLSFLLNRDMGICPRKLSKRVSFSRMRSSNLDCDSLCFWESNWLNHGNS